MQPKLIILGAGESGVGTAVLAKQKGFEVFLSDNGLIKPFYKEELEEFGIDYEENGHTVEKFQGASLVVKSPGIPDKVQVVKNFKALNIPVISEIEFASRYTSAKIIGITGSNGKTTTTLLIYHLLQKAGFNVGLAGNVGQSFARQVALQSYDWYVIELSSFQLDGMYDARCNIAVLTNITPDHLDRYDYQFQNYIDSKFRVVQNQQVDDVFIFSGDCPTVGANLSKFEIKASKLPFSKNEVVGNGAWFDGNELHFKIKENSFKISSADVSLRGLHNMYNAMSAVMVAVSAGADLNAIREGLATFPGVEHRLEMVKTVSGVNYINDSKATNVDSAWYALDSMTTPVVWIAGGTDKGNDYAPLADLVKSKVKALICLGVDNSKLLKEYSGVVPVVVESKSMPDAIAQAQKLASAGDSVLLSPCCASFDLFNNYEHRGKLFKEAVSQLNS